MNNSFLMTNSLVLGIMQFCARVAERQTRRSQKPLSKDVRVQIPPRAPLHMIKACFSASLFSFRAHSIRPFGMQTNVPRNICPTEQFRKARNKNAARIATFLRLRIAAGRQSTDFGPKTYKIGHKTVQFRFAKTRGNPQSQKKIAKTLGFLFSRWADQPNGRMSATNRSAQRDRPAHPMLTELAAANKARPMLVQMGRFCSSL